MPQVALPSNNGSGNLTMFDQEWLLVASDLVMTAKGDPPTVSPGVERFFTALTSRDSFNGQDSALELHTRLSTALAYFYLTAGWSVTPSNCSHAQTGLVVRLAEGGTASLIVSKYAPVVQVQRGAPGASAASTPAPLRSGYSPLMPPPPVPGSSPFAAATLPAHLFQQAMPVVSEPPDTLLAKRSGVATDFPTSGSTRVFRRDWK